MPQHPAIHPHDEHVRAWDNWLFECALFGALKQASALARLTRRRGDAHKLLIEAHMYHLAEGGGREEMLAFVDGLTAQIAFSERTPLTLALNDEVRGRG